MSYNLFTSPLLFTQTKPLIQISTNGKMNHDKSEYIRQRSSTLFFVTHCPARVRCFPASAPDSTNYLQV